ncbi:MAG TPA: glutamate--cysteine ligase [Sedimenticola thiotaurini]|uniref:Glutamate--cysteine ligase n=1 Tax=Sedimenticola thiotaurini TaxID=1543721 RepID=A0A831W8Q6_9GAMM|nr:glutamate--cysteine ligase [Sedimenticola thiotaurini]
MGQEISSTQFTADDFEEFGERLARETGLLEEWLESGGLASDEQVGGFELEAWLVDEEMRPSPINETLLDRLGDPLVVPELARFNLEINGTPQALHGDALTRLADELTATWSKCEGLARDLSAHLMMIGILPTLRLQDFDAANMSSMQRYTALDEQLAQLRGHPELHIDLHGRDQLRFVHEGVMLESATTSFQIHLKVDAAQAGRFYNASKILSAPMVAVSANSPYFLGADLWAESRICLFEQSVQVGLDPNEQRVTLGRGYVDSIADCFRINQEHYPVLLPQLMDEPEAELPHLRLHNGTIWRWNRPLVGFSGHGRPHIRIEHRVVPAGPTVTDSLANAAFYFGLVNDLARQPVAPELRLPFGQARANFYQAARLGLEAELVWLGGERGGVRALCREHLLPRARNGLAMLGIDRVEIDRWLGVIDGRLENGQNGAAWQRAWVARHGSDMAALTAAYLERQQSGRPVHEWDL